MRKSICLISFVAASLVSSLTFASCKQPSKPVCASNDEIYNKREAYRVCQAEIESYHEVALKYIDCLKADLANTVQQVQAKIDSVSAETNSVIKEFNCKSGMEEEC